MAESRARSLNLASGSVLTSAVFRARSLNLASGSVLTSAVPGVAPR